MYDLSCIGLGKKRHAFKKGDHDYLRKELEAPFPKLKAADGKFLLHRTLGGGSGKRSLHKIPLGPQGYTIKWLQENIAMGAACIYALMPTLPDNLGVSWIQNESPGLPYGSPNLLDKIDFESLHHCKRKSRPQIYQIKTMSVSQTRRAIS